MPIVLPNIISKDLKYLKKIGSKGEFIEAESWYGNKPHKMLFLVHVFNKNETLSKVKGIR